MALTKTPVILTYFETLTDPRVERTKRHRLSDLVAIALCARRFAARARGPTWSGLATRSSIGSAPFCVWSMASRRTTRLAVSSSCWTPASSTVAWPVGSPVYSST